jgi:hypothetical protein
MFLSEPLQRKYGPCIYLLYDFVVLRLVSYHIDVEVVQKETQLLPEDGTVLPIHVGAIVKRKIKKYTIQYILLVILYILLSSVYISYD